MSGSLGYLSTSLIYGNKINLEIFLNKGHGFIKELKGIKGSRSLNSR